MISKRKSRRVIVGNTSFRHKISVTPLSDGIYRLNITIQSETHNASKLVVTGLIQKDISVWPLTDHQEIGYYPTVTKHEIAWFIREAIHNGWDHRSNGPNFVLEASNEIFHPSFWASERADNPIPPQGSSGDESGRIEPEG